MALKQSVSDHKVVLPPAFRLVTLRESGDAFAQACRTAAEHGAGTLVWVRRYDLAEFAVVLEPEEPLGSARRAMYICMNALADTLSAFVPPEMSLTFDWPDAIRVDGVLVGGGRLGWPEGMSEQSVPDWLVFSGMIRTAVIRASDPGLRPLLGGLDELGLESLDAGEVVAGFARHLMAGFHDWASEGFATAEAAWFRRFAAAGGPFTVAENGDCIASMSQHRRSLLDALQTPSWLNPSTGTPWL